jgi:hypothetical protein
MKITPEVTVNQSPKSQNNASWRKLARHTRAKAASSETQLWRIFAIQWAVFFFFIPEISGFGILWSKYLSKKVLAQEVLKELLFCYELV